MRRLPSAALALGALAIAAPVAGAQRLDAEPAVRFGLVGGVNFANLAGDDAEGAEARMGFVGGVSLLYRFTSVVGFQPELLYSQKGAKTSGSFEGITFSLTNQLDYVEVPLLLRLDLGSTGSMRPFLLAGPSLAYNLSCKFKVSAFGESETVDCDDLEGELDAPLDIEDFDAGATVGAGIDLPFGARSFSIGVRYTHGLRDVATGSDLRNRTFAAVAGLRF